MNLKDFCRNLKESGMTNDQALSFIREWVEYPITMKEYKQYVGTKHHYIEIQRRDIISHRLRDAFPPDVYESYFNWDTFTYDRKCMMEDTGFNVTDIEHIRNIRKDEVFVDYFTKDVRRRIFEADGYLCTRCEDKARSIYHGLQTHHIIRGGGDNFENGVTLCGACHRWLHHLKALPTQYHTRGTWQQYLLKYRFKGHRAHLTRHKIIIPNGYGFYNNTVRELNGERPLEVSFRKAQLERDRDETKFWSPRHAFDVDAIDIDDGDDD